MCRYWIGCKGRSLMAKRGANGHQIQSRVSKTIILLLFSFLFAECTSFVLYDGLLDDWEQVTWSSFSNRWNGAKNSLRRIQQLASCAAGNRNVWWWKSQSSTPEEVSRKSIIFPATTPSRSYTWRTKKTSQRVQSVIGWTPQAIGSILGIWSQQALSIKHISYQTIKHWIRNNKEWTILWWVD